MRRLAFASLLLVSALATAQIDEGYTKKIREYTTEPFFLTELVDHLPSHPTVPTPEKFLGHIIGAPNVLTYTDQITAYMRSLDAASDRVKVISLGQSEEGREMILLAISDEANMAKLDEYRQINKQLGDPRTIDDAKAETLIKQGLPMYLLTGGMHSPESGPPEMLMELAYRLAVGESEFIQNIRKNAITLIIPVLDVDGRDRWVDTYLYSKKFPDKPEIPLVYWGKYVAHDTNRDGMALSLKLNQAMWKTWFEFYPQVMHDLHESVPYLYISTGTGPYNPWLDPITIDEWHLMAYEEVNELTRRSVPGVWTHGFFDGWAANYGFYVANGHNGIGRFYETFGGYGADTAILNTGSRQSRAWYRPSPPHPRVRWSIRNNTNLMQSGVLVGLSHVAREREKFLRNYYLKSKRSVAKARTEGPAAWVLPADETRVGQQRALALMLANQGIELHRTVSAVDTKDGKVPANSIVIRMDQPYSRMADLMLDTQFYSATDPQPYDDTGWTLGPLFNVKTMRIKDEKFLDAKMVRAHEGATPAGAKVNAKDVILVRPTGDFTIAQLRYRHRDWNIAVADDAFKVKDQSYPKGTLMFRGSGSAPVPEMFDEIQHLGLRPVGVAKLPDGVKTHPLEAARIAVVHTWTDTQDEGWYRMALDTLRIPYEYISVHGIRDTTDLKSKYDVIILAPTGDSAQEWVNGIPKVGEPIPWKPMDGFKHLGGPDTSDDIRGGIELEGVLHLREFVRKGGLLVAVENAMRLPVQYGLVSRVSLMERENLIAPGGVYLTKNEAADSLVTSGYDATVGVYFSANRSPMLSVGGGFGGFGGGGGGRASGRGTRTDADIIQARPPYTPEKKPGDSDTPTFNNGPQAPAPQVLLRFESEDKVLLSGALQNGARLANTPAAVLCSNGEGNVLLLALNPMWRMQTHGSYQLLFNAAMNYRHLKKPEEKKAKGS